MLDLKPHHGFFEEDPSLMRTWDSWDTLIISYNLQHISNCKQLRGLQHLWLISWYLLTNLQTDIADGDHGGVPSSPNRQLRSSPGRSIKDRIAEYLHSRASYLSIGGTALLAVWRNNCTHMNANDLCCDSSVSNWSLDSAPAPQHTSTWHTLIEMRTDLIAVCHTPA